MGTKSGESSTGRKKKKIVWRLCNGARKTLGHMLQDCKELKRENSTIQGILKGEEEGVAWMRMVLEKGDKKKHKMKQEVKTKATS